MYNQFKNKGINDNNFVKIKKEDFENLARENQIHNVEDFYNNEFFKSNFISNSEIINGQNIQFIYKEL